MKHKRHRPKHRRAGCLMCKPWKARKLRSITTRETGNMLRRQDARRYISAQEQGA